MQTAYAIAASVLDASRSRRGLNLPTRPRLSRPELLTDAQSFHGGSFRPGWGPGGRLIHSGRRTAADAHRAGGVQSLADASIAEGSPHAPNATVVLERFAPTAGGDDVDALRGALEIALAHTVRAGAGGGGDRAIATGGPRTPGRDSPDASGPSDNLMSDALMFDDDDDATADGTHGPSLRFRCTRLQLPSLCAAHLSAIKRTRANSSAPKEEFRVEAAAWDLLAVVFGDAPDGAPRGSAADRHRRRAGVGAWLRRLIAGKDRETSDPAGTATFNPSGPSTSTTSGSATLTHLAAGRGVKATASAVGARDSRLATLLAQSNAGGKGGDLAAAQLAIWRSSPAGAYVSGNQKAAFGLLAGEVAPPPVEVARIGGGKNDGLTWRGNFGLHLWFRRAPTATIASSLEGYLEAIEKGAAEFPAAPGSLTVDPEASRLKDVCFNILALASSGVVPDDVSVEKTFHPLTYCTDDLTNVALAWHLFVAMRAIGALGKGTKVAALADDMHVAFASQLLAAGAGGGGMGDARRKKVRAGAGDGDSMVEWAAYVAMHVEDGARRERLVRSTLHGRCADWCDDEGKTSFLRDVLGVPTPWLEEARREWFDYNWWETD